LHQLADLVDRPVPDQLNKSKDRRNALLQKVQELIENLFHRQASLAPEWLSSGRTSGNVPR
jgi:hypothetical protein